MKERGHTMSRQQAQAITLNQRANMHEGLGNTLLASWMRASAEHFKELERRIDRALDEMPLGNYEDTSYSRRKQYTKDWFEYEEEYAYNFDGLE